MPKETITLNFETLGWGGMSERARIARQLESDTMDAINALSEQIRKVAAGVEQGIEQEAVYLRDDLMESCANLLTSLKSFADGVEDGSIAA